MLTLYLFIGAPGAGKTTIAETVARLCSAKHLCADAERHKLFPPPTHSKSESIELYTQLNATTEYLLEKGTSVVFDTNFNFYSDRQKLRTIATKYNAATVLLWLTTPLELARKRAVDASTTRNGYVVSMSGQQFDEIISKLEPPRNNEVFIKIDGTNIDEATIKRLLRL